MLKKIEKARLFLVGKNLARLRCPICHESLSLEGNALICGARHTFNLNKKGYVNFLRTAADSTHYTRKLFEPRRRLIQSGMYDGLLTEIQAILAGDALLDIGTGEGSFLQRLKFDGAPFAFDLAKDGIEMATELDMNAFLSLSDLTNLPFVDRSMTTLLNILTPSNYTEFKRVLAPAGRLIKVVPDRHYLQELRTAFALPLEYDNTAVIQRFEKEFPDFERKEILYEFAIPAAFRVNFLAMSPLEWAVPASVKFDASQNPPTKATIHLQLLIGQAH